MGKSWSPEERGQVIGSGGEAASHYENQQTSTTELAAAVATHLIESVEVAAPRMGTSSGRAPVGNTIPFVADGVEPSKVIRAEVVSTVIRAAEAPLGTAMVATFAVPVDVPWEVLNGSSPTERISDFS
jgi:hypothetical protein